MVPLHGDRIYGEHAYAFERNIWGLGFRALMDGCQNTGPLLGTLNIRCPILIGNQKGTKFLTSTYIGVQDLGFRVLNSGFPN